MRLGLSRAWNHFGSPDDVESAMILVAFRSIAKLPNNHDQTAEEETGKQGEGNHSALLSTYRALSRGYGRIQRGQIRAFEVSLRKRPAIMSEAASARDWWVEIAGSYAWMA